MSLGECLIWRFTSLKQQHQLRSLPCCRKYLLWFACFEQLSEHVPSNFHGKLKGLVRYTLQAMGFTVAYCTTTLQQLVLTGGITVTPRYVWKVSEPLSSWRNYSWLVGLTTFLWRSVHLKFWQTIFLSFRHAGFLLSDSLCSSKAGKGEIYPKGVYITLVG